MRIPLVLLVMLALAAGCASPKSPRFAMGGVADVYGLEAAPASAPVGPASRMLIWRAQLGVEVGDVNEAARQAGDMARAAGGLVEREWNDGETTRSLTLRVPMTVFSNTVSSLEQMGTVLNRNVSSDDVTEEFVDTDARLKNMIALRDRLRELLAKATEVKDLLAIETELGRIQGDIESMEARLRSLKGQVDLSEINITFTRRPILGPLGYVVKGVYWAGSKLFVLRP
jgi:hypothetical protein